MVERPFVIQLTTDISPPYGYYKIRKYYPNSKADISIVLVAHHLGKDVAGEIAVLIADFYEVELQITLGIDGVDIKAES